MAAPKIKKRAVNSKVSPVPRQGTVPCLILVALALVLAGVLLYFSLRTAG